MMSKRATKAKTHATLLSFLSFTMKQLRALIKYIYTNHVSVPDRIKPVQAETTSPTWTPHP